MRNALHTTCDCCAEVLEGLKGTAQINNDYISIKGSVCIQMYSKQFERYNYYYAQPQNAINQFLHFCNARCFNDYLQARLQIINKD